MTPSGGVRPGAGRIGYKDPLKIRKPRSIRFSDAEWEQLENQSKQAGFKNTSDYIRALAKLDTGNKETPDQ